MHAFINWCAMLTQEVADIIIPLHVITGCAHTLGFYGHGEKKVLEKVMSDPEARKFLGRVGESLVLEVKTDM